MEINGDVTDAGRTNDERRRTREDSATQPMDAGWLSFAKRTSVKEMEEELKASEIGNMLIKRGGSLTVPVVDYIKEKYKLLSVETTERLEKELKGIVHQFFFYRSNFIFWIVMGCGIAEFGRRGL